MSSFKRYSLAALLAALLVTAVLLTSCVNFDSSSINDLPPLDFSDDPVIDDEVSEPPTKEGYTARPTVTAIVNTSPEIVVISGTCEEGAVVTATSPVDSVSVNSLNGYYIIEYDLDGRDSRSLLVTAKVDGKETSTAREIVVKRDAMAETRTDEFEVVLGKDGYLFFRETIDNYCGNNLITVSALNNFLSNTLNAQITALENRAGGNEVELIYVLIPNASVAYGEYLPEDAEKETYDTLYDQISNALNKSNATFIDMKTVFEQHKDDGYLLYNKTDSHITDYAGYLVYTELMNHIAQKFPAAAPYGLDQFTISEETAVNGGNLASYGQLDPSSLKENYVSVTPNFSLDMGDSAHRLKLTTTNLMDLQKYAGDGSCQIVSDTVEEGKTNILNRLYFCTEREELPSAMIYRDDSSAMFADYLAERFNNCMLGVSGDYVVNFTDAGRHASAGKSIVDYVIVIIDENNLDQLVK